MTNGAVALGLFDPSTAPRYNGPTSTVPVEQIERDLSRYLAQVDAGEKLVLTRAGKPIAEITPIARAVDRSPAIEETAAETELRPIGLAEGRFVQAPGFDASLPEELLRLFEGPSR